MSSREEKVLVNAMANLMALPRVILAAALFKYSQDVAADKRMKRMAAAEADFTLKQAALLRQTIMNEEDK